MLVLAAVMDFVFLPRSEFGLLLESSMDITKQTFGTAKNIDHFYSIKMYNDTTTGSAWHILDFVRLHGDLDAAIGRQKWHHIMKSRSTS
jgi:hypothetical protein